MSDDPVYRHLDRKRLRDKAWRLAHPEHDQYKFRKTSLWRKNWEKGRSARAFKALVELLGNSCACCGSTEHLQVDHKQPQNGTPSRGNTRILAEVRRNPSQFQMLCVRCNNWKSNGPCCPCKYWDQVSPDWRRLIQKVAEPVTVPRMSSPSGLALGA